MFNSMAGLFLRVLQIAAGLLGATALDSQDIGRRWFHSGKALGFFRLDLANHMA